MNPDYERPSSELAPINAPTRAEDSSLEPMGMPDFHKLPKELGVMLLSAGVVGFVMPGPGTPAIIAGGLVLWPKGFGKAEVWFRHRFPTVHRGGMKHIQRFLADLEKRYPGSIR